MLLVTVSPSVSFTNRDIQTKKGESDSIFNCTQIDLSVGSKKGMLRRDRRVFSPDN